MTGQKVDTDDGATGVGVALGLAALAFTTLFAVVGVASWAFNRMRQAAGVEEQSIPGV